MKNPILLLLISVPVSSLFTTESLHRRGGGAGGRVHSENATGVSIASVMLLVAVHTASKLSEHLQANPSGG